jgi:hypothetical protein
MKKTGKKAVGRQKKIEGEWNKKRGVKSKE